MLYLGSGYFPVGNLLTPDYLVCYTARRSIRAVLLFLSVPLFNRGLLTKGPH